MIFARASSALLSLLGVAWLLSGTACVETADLGTLPDASDDVPNLQPDGSRADVVDGARPNVTTCKSSPDCLDAEEYCAKPVGKCEVIGVCTPIPKHCPPGGPPVCDCEDTYRANACEAARAGTSVSSSTTCGAGPQFEGGMGEAAPTTGDP